MSGLIYAHGRMYFHQATAKILFPLASRHGEAPPHQKLQAYDAQPMSIGRHAPARFRCTRHQFHAPCPGRRRRSAAGGLHSPMTYAFSRPLMLADLYWVARRSLTLTAAYFIHDAYITITQLKAYRQFSTPIKQRMPAYNTAFSASQSALDTAAAKLGRCRSPKAYAI